MEKERIAIEKLRNEIEEQKRKEQIEAAKPWRDKELRSLKGTGRPLTKWFDKAIRNSDPIDVINHLNYGEDANQEFWRGWGYNTPLNVAAEEGHTLIAALLIKEGADVKKYGSYRNSNYFEYPIHTAILYKKADADFIKMLLENGADVNAKSGKTWACNYCTPLKMISRVKDHPHALEIVKILKKYGGTY